jgi:hypothetical protein
MSNAHSQQRGRPLDILKTEADIAKLQAEAMKLLAETHKINRENRWMPVVYAVGFLGAAAGFAKLFLH